MSGTPEAEKLRVGAVTIGQSPRTDVIPEVAPLLPGVEVLERGALDELDEAELQALRQSARQHTLVSRLRDGREIVLDEAAVWPRLQQAVHELEQSGVQLILVLCTGSFPAISAHVPLLLPDRVLQGLVRAVALRGKLGVLTPHAEQCEMQRARWSAVLGSEDAKRVCVAAASPYPAAPLPAVERAALSLAQAGAELIVLDCLGYTQTMRAKVRAVTGVPTLLARTALARAAAELLGV